MEYAFAPGLADRFNTTLSISSTAIPYGHLLSSANGDTISTVTFGEGSGDQWQAIVASVEELLDNV